MTVTDKIIRPDTVALSLDAKIPGLYVLGGYGNVTIEGVFVGNLLVGGQVCLKADHVDGTVRVLDQAIFEADSVTALITDGEGTVKVGSVTEHSQLYGRSRVFIGWADSVRVDNACRARINRAEGVIECGGDGATYVGEASAEVRCMQGAKVHVGLLHSEGFAHDASTLAVGTAVEHVYRDGDAVLIIGLTRDAAHINPSGYCKVGCEDYLNIVRSGEFAGQWPLNAMPMVIDYPDNSEGLKP